MKYLLLIVLISSCNALSLLNNKSVSDVGGFNSDIGDDDGNRNCPSNYIKINGNNSLGTSEFCVMRIEARNNSSGLPSAEDSFPIWTNINLTSAKSACQNLGTRYDLISNPQWMTIARELEGNPSNWSGATVGSGCIFRGNNGLTPAGCNSNEGDPESVPTSARSGSIANLKLNSGEEIWDISANVQEWVDWTTGGSLGLAPKDCLNDIELNAVTGCGLNSDDFMPLTFAYSSAEGMGKYFGGGNASTGGAALRGGDYLEGLSNGIYRLALDADPTYSNVDTGFRCVYRFQ
jgi:hypothetical protein